MTDEKEKEVEAPFPYLHVEHDYYDACPKCGHPMVYIDFKSGTKYMCNNTGCE